MDTDLKPQFQKFAMTRYIAFYLPYFHFTPENDEWWGQDLLNGQMFSKLENYLGDIPNRKHLQIGDYDLRLPETREAQASLARQYEIEGAATGTIASVMGKDKEHRKMIWHHFF